MILPMENGRDMEIDDEINRNRKAQERVLSSGRAIFSNLITSLVPPLLEPSWLSLADRLSCAAWEAFAERLKDWVSSMSSSSGLGLFLISSRYERWGVFCASARMGECAKFREIPSPTDCLAGKAKGLAVASGELDAFRHGWMARMGHVGVNRVDSGRSWVDRTKAAAAVLVAAAGRGANSESRTDWVAP